MFDNLVISRNYNPREGLRLDKRRGLSSFALSKNVSVISMISY